MALMTFGIFRQLSWAITAFSLGFCAVFLTYADLRLRGYDAVAEGKVSKVERTSSTENDEPIYAVDAEFRADDSAHERAQVRTIRSYTTSPPQVYEVVTVDYEAEDPSEARIRGARTRRFSPLIAGVVLIPLVGLFSATYRVRESVRILGLLRHGRQTTAKLVAKHKPPPNDDGEAETTLTLQFTDEDGEARTFAVRTFAPGPLEDDEREVILYDPRNPTRATALDHLPGKLDVRDDAIVAHAAAWPLLITPALTVLGLVATIAAQLLYHGS
jgi:hypothetical protein